MSDNTKNNLKQADLKQTETSSGIPVELVYRAEDLAGGDAVAEAGLQLHRVEKILIIMYRAVIHRLDRGCRVSRRLTVVIHLRSSHRHTRTIRQTVVRSEEHV